jgi:tRNA pseudouridine38-40 synthase
MRTIMLTLAYDGSNYHGWQVQLDLVTVQSVIEATLAEILGQPTRIVGSGRTDAGVHALGQVVTFNTDHGIPAAGLMKALNTRLPSDISVLSACEKPLGFHAIRNAVRKRYRYTIENREIHDVFRRRQCWHYRGPLNVAHMREAAEHLVGTHDFRSFESGWPKRVCTVRTIHALEVGHAADDERMLRIDVEGDGFLYNMVRNIVGSLIEVGRGFRAADWMLEVLAARDRRAAGPTAPPHGLCMLWVECDDTIRPREPRTLQCEPSE